MSTNFGNCPTCCANRREDRRIVDEGDDTDTYCDDPWHDDAPPTPPAPADDAGCIIVKSPRPCPDCDGTGWLAGDPCPLCSGLAPGEREDARLKHQRAVEKARRAADASGAEAMRAEFLAWINAGYLVRDAVTPVEWDDEGLPVYYTRDDGVRHYLDGEWHAWQAARALPLTARRGASEAVVEAEIATLRNALACAAVPLEVLAATECDDAGKALAPTTKAAVLRGRDAIRAALRGTEESRSDDSRPASGQGCA